MRRARCSKQKIVDIFLYYMYIARVVPSFYEADLQVRENRGTHDIVSCANRKRLSDRVLKKKKKKEKREVDYYFVLWRKCKRERARTRESSSAVERERVEWNLYIVL